MNGEIRNMSDFYETFRTKINAKEFLSHQNAHVSFTREEIKKRQNYLKKEERFLFVIGSLLDVNQKPSLILPYEKFFFLNERREKIIETFDLINRRELLRQECRTCNFRNRVQCTTTDTLVILCEKADIQPECGELVKKEIFYTICPECHEITETTI